DCMITLDHRVTDQVSTRRMRVVKYRGSPHGTNEYPFLIDESGLTVIPITSMGLNHEASTERVSSGIPKLDEMLEGDGFFRGTSILVSGTAGSGKSSVAAAFADGACRRGERCLYFAFEESPSQIVRNMKSIGINLQPWLEKGLLEIDAARPSHYGLETHLAGIQKRILEVKPHAVIVDPITNFTTGNTAIDVKAMVSRLIDFLKSQQITTMFVSLTGGGEMIESTEVGISSLMDAWIILRDMEVNGERNRVLYLVKARGVAHSNQVREFVLTSKGIQLVDAYLGGNTVLTGSARLAQKAQERLMDLEHKQEAEATQRRIERERQVLETQIATLQVEYEAKKDELKRAMGKEQLKETMTITDQATMEQSRKVSVRNSRPNKKYAKR
ncbi:MAG TPA: circadian clock protein KaiC, partial [Nitrospiria bacterium]|nr:circadian clock protein KaiC [Nitrospiria bacterium]